MPYVITFEKYRPAPRFPPVTDPWTLVRIEESATKDGPWTELETTALDPVDTDPQWPRSRRITTELATLLEGWYRLVWIDAAGSEQPTAPILNTQSAPGVSWAPSVQDVADLSPAYTRYPVDQSGQQSGAAHKVFDESTDPTDAQVLGLITVAVREVLSRVGVQIPRLENYGDLAKTAAAWHAAATIEAEKAPEGAAETSGAYSWKQASYVANLNELIRQARPTLVR